MPPAFRNRVLSALPATDLAIVRGEAQRVSYPLGHTLAHPETPATPIFFPDNGVISVVDVLESGHNVEVAAIGAEGLVGLSAVMDVDRVPFWLIVQVPATGLLLPATVFTHLFSDSETFRRETMAHVGRMLVQLGRSASCNRFHSHRQRLARWLIVLRRKSGEASFETTHEFIAQMVGGPRHAVSAALNELRELGAIHYTRGRIDVVDFERLLTSACQCYRYGDGIGEA